MPDFWCLFPRSAKPAELHVWAFDLFSRYGKDLRKGSMELRQCWLQTLLSPLTTARRNFAWPRDAPYRSGVCREWWKIKTTPWHEANKHRWRLFEA